MEDVRQDIAFLRAVVEDHDATMALDGAILAAVGLIFGCVSLFYWSIAAGLSDVPVPWNQWAWVAGVVTVVPVVLFLQRRFPRPPGPAARAIRAAWLGVGTGITVAAAAFALGSWQVQEPRFVLWAFPVVLFTLYGAAWSVAFAARRHGAFALIAAGCYGAALACGFLSGRPEEWLVLALGLFALVAVPGYAIVTRANGAA
jgi:hypothetical protein